MVQSVVILTWTDHEINQMSAMHLGVRACSITVLLKKSPYCLTDF